MRPPGIVLAIITIAYFYVLNTSIKTAEASLPPIGAFFNPFSGFWQNAEPQALPAKTKVAADMQGATSVVYDHRLVPHIFAEKELDLAYVQGYLHAENRLWQMDMTARQASGRLTEVFGERLLPLDQRNRNVGMAWSAERHAASWKSCDGYPLLEAYVAGANAYIETLTDRTKPLEYKLFNYDPEPWSAYKTALVMMSMNQVLCSRNEDIQASNTREAIGAEDFDYLFPHWNPKQSPIIPESVEWDFEGASFEPMVPTISRQESSYENTQTEHVGSNNWAVSGKRTRSGLPILCNDPHLQLTLPSIWYEMHLVGPYENVYGVSLPGVPQVIIGFNHTIAWGQTNVGIDVSDFYRVEWTDEAKTKYRLDGEEMSVELREETYIVKGAGQVKDTVKYTSWGPVYKDSAENLALRWLPHDPSDHCVLNAFVGLNRGEDYEDYLQAIESFESPPQNFVFASEAGDIALKVQGRFPIKGPGQGRFVQDGSNSDAAWKGYIPFRETPLVKNPERGYVSSANQHSTDQSYPYAYTGYFEDYRGRTLNQALDRLTDVTPEDMMELQQSTYSLLAAELLPVLSSYVSEPLKATEQRWFDVLQTWDYRYEADLQAPIVFDLWRRYFEELTWDELSDELLQPETWRTVALAEEEPQYTYFDQVETEPVETAYDIALLSFQRAVTKMDSLIADDPDLTLAQHRSIGIPHLSRIPAFSENNLTIGGNSSALNAISRNNAPSWRMVVALGERPKAWGVYPGGQSGNPGSPYYKTGIKPWMAGEYYKLALVDTPEQLADQTLQTKTFGR